MGMGIRGMIIGLFLLVGAVHCFVFSWDEIKYKLINSTVEIPARYVCLSGASEMYSDNLRKIYARANNISVSFSELNNGPCVENDGESLWRIVAESSVNMDRYCGGVLIFSSSEPEINLAEDSYQNDMISLHFPSDQHGLEQVFTSTWDDILIYTENCTGSGNVTVFTGAGAGIEEKRFPMKSWRCDDLPGRIFSFDNAFTIKVDVGVQLTVKYTTFDWHDENIVSHLDRIAVMSSGLSDNVAAVRPEVNYVVFYNCVDDCDNTELTVTAWCSPCTFDPNYDGFVTLNGQRNGVPEEQIIRNESISTINCGNQGLSVDYLPTQIAPEDLWGSEDNFVVELLFEDPTQPTMPTLDTELDPYCNCDLDKKFGLPDGWDSMKIWIDAVIILDISEAMKNSFGDACSLIESLIGTDDGDVLNTDTTANFYTRVGLIAMSDKPEVLYNLNMTKSDKVRDKTQIDVGVTQINVVDAFNSALNMFNDGLASKPDRTNTRQVIYYMTDSDPKANLGPLNQFKTSQGIIIVNNFLEKGEVERPGLKEMASDGYYYTNIQDNYMLTIQLFCKANCYCRPDKGVDPYPGWNTDPAVRASGGCFHAAPIGVPFSKAKSNCDSLGGGLIASIHDEMKAQFLQQLMVTAAPKSDYFWIGYTKSDAGWNWEDQSNNPYTNWDTDEPNSNTVSKCAYIDTTTPGLYWGAGNCNVGFPSVCEFAPCAVGNNIC